MSLRLLGALSQKGNEPICLFPFWDNAPSNLKEIFSVHLPNLKEIFSTILVEIFSVILSGRNFFFETLQMIQSLVDSTWVYLEFLSWVTLGENVRRDTCLLVSWDESRLVIQDLTAIQATKG